MLISFSRMKVNSFWYTPILAIPSSARIRFIHIAERAHQSKIEITNRRMHHGDKYFALNKVQFILLSKNNLVEAKGQTLGTLGGGFRFHENLLLTFDELHTWILHFATAFLLKSLRDSKMISQLIQILRIISVPYTTVKMSIAQEYSQDISSDKKA